MNSSEENRIVRFLERVATHHEIQRGIELADSGRVLESYRNGTHIHALVSDAEDLTFTVELNVRSEQELDGSCSCSTAQHTWCAHVVAVVWAARELGFFDCNSGFASRESFHRPGVSSAREIARVLRDVMRHPTSEQPSSDFAPQVAIGLELESDRLGVRVEFDNEIRMPAVFRDFARRSSRALDNILLQTLDTHGDWDEERALWYISMSSDIETLLGLIQEYQAVFLLPSDSSDRELYGKDLIDSEPVRFPRELLHAEIQVTWSQLGADLQLVWRLPNNEANNEFHEIIGTGPYWTGIGNCVYRLSAAASQIVSIFPYSSRIALTRSQAGPLLEFLKSLDSEIPLVRIVNPEQQPRAEIATPTPLLNLQLAEFTPDALGSMPAVKIQASLEFEYPEASVTDNVVYLPNRAAEEDFAQLLRDAGFSSTGDRQRYWIEGERALDYVADGVKVLSKPWQVTGLSAVRKALRFSELSIHMAVSESSDVDSIGSSTSLKTGLAEWYDCQVTLVQNNAHVPLSSLFKNASSASDKWVVLDSGAFARVPGGGLTQLRATLGAIDPNYRLSNSVKKRISSAQALSLSRAVDQGIDLRLDQNLRRFVSKLTGLDRIPKIKPKKTFDGELRAYQLDGLRWLHFLGSCGLNGILADEMGLGKTIQTLALLQYIKRARSKPQPSLVIAPTSILTNWYYEARKFVPNLKVLVLQGPQRKQHFKSIPEYDLVLSSYALLRIDRKELELHKFKYVILDEAQNIKNPTTATSKAAKALRSEHRLALTGTPTENRPLELWSILDFLMPGYLGTLEFFKSHLERPILEGGPQVPVARILNARTRPFILRRIKADVEQDLPPKIESVVRVSMTPSQRELYAQVLQEVRPRVFEAIKKRGVRGASVPILAALLRLRQVCNHPNSIDAFSDLKGYQSGKFLALCELIQEALDSGNKILLFSQFLAMLRIIREWLDAEKIPHLYMDGSTKKRQDLVDQFNNDENIRIFVSSLKTGGTGLNLTGADTVIIYDPWWNPAVEDQAADRAHRIGQKKTVNVYRLMTEHSIEERIMSLKDRKSELVDALVNDNGLSTLKLSKADVEGLFEFFAESDPSS